MSPPRSEGSVYISSITVNVQEELGRSVDHIILQTEAGTFKKELPIQVSPGHEHQEVFDPAVELSARDRLSVSMQYPARWKGIRTPSITMELGEIMTEAQDDGHGNQISSFKLHKNIEVAIGVSYSAASENSNATTNEILTASLRFRLLMIGNTGVGKSTLIRNVFGVKDVDVSAASRGRADSDREYIAPENDLFVVHDSVGLEAAEGSNFKKVKDFIGDRRRRENLEDRLHAVWMCLAIPYAKGRLLEAGMEEFLRNRKEILGDIPIVVVLTKLDMLDRSLITDLRKEGVAFKTIEEAKPFLEPRRTAFIKEYCSQPLLRAAEGSVPHVAVSTKSGYRLETTLYELVKTTISEIQRSYDVATERPSIERDVLVNIVRMAMPPNIEVKVDLTIALAKKSRYWTNLGASLRFSNDKVKEYLLGMHQGIIQVWNINDPEMVLQDDSFKVALLDSPMGEQITKSIVKSFMAYIVDLIYVMKILFILVQQGSVASRDVALAMEVYNKSMYRNRVHSEIGDFGASFVMLPRGREAVLEKIEALIRQYNITYEEVSRLRSQIHAAPGSSRNVLASS